MTASRLVEALLLVGQGVGKSRPDRAVLRADQQVNVGNFVAFAGQGFADEHRHGCISLRNKGSSCHAEENYIRRGLTRRIETHWEGKKERGRREGIPSASRHGRWPVGWCRQTGRMGSDPERERWPVGFTAFCRGRHQPAVFPPSRRKPRLRGEESENTPIIGLHADRQLTKARRAEKETSEAACLACRGLTSLAQR